MTRQSSVSRLAGLVVIALLLLALVAPPAARARDASYANFVVDLVVEPDGDFRITEQITARFVGGPFTEGYRILTLPRTTGIGEVSVVEIVDGVPVPYAEAASKAPGTFRRIERAAEIEVVWYFTSTSSETRTWVLAYTEFGALRSYPDETPPNQQVWYKPVGADLSDTLPIERATFRITLPAAIDPSAARVQVDADQHDSAAGFTQDGRVFIFDHGAFDRGEDWEIRLQLPIVAPDAPVPPWQAADDDARARADRETALNGIALLAALFLLIAGSITIFVVWWLRGRDPRTGLVADFLPAPPDDTPAGVVGALIDERVHERDLVATLMDLGRLGLVKIHIAPGREIMFERLPGATPTSEIDRRLVAMLFPDPSPAPDERQTVSLSRAAHVVQDGRAYFTDVIYADLVQRGYFSRSPEATRSAWTFRAMVVTALSILAGIGLSLLVSPWMAAPAIVVTVLSLAVRFTGGRMPQRTRSGAEAAAKWLAFRRYLEHLEQYDRVDTARANFETYLPYAVAFGLESSWISRFQTAVATPGWFDLGDLGNMPDVLPRMPHRPILLTGSPAHGGLPDIGMPDIGLPSLGDLSKGASRQVSRGSHGTVDLLSVLGALIEIASLFAGGGGRGGSSGGGGGGFR